MKTFPRPHPFLSLALFGGLVFACTLPSDPGIRRARSGLISSEGSRDYEAGCPHMRAPGDWCWPDFDKLYTLLYDRWNTAPAGCFEAQQRLLAMLDSGLIVRSDDQEAPAWMQRDPGSPWNGGARILIIGLNSRELYQQYWEIGAGMLLRHEYGHGSADTSLEEVANSFMSGCTVGSSQGFPAPVPPNE